MLNPPLLFFKINAHFSLKLSLIAFADISRIELIPLAVLRCFEKLNMVFDIRSLFRLCCSCFLNRVTNMILINGIARNIKNCSQSSGEERDGVP